MSMTIAEKILAQHSSKKEVSPGEFVDAAVDRVMVHEALGLPGGVAELFESLGIQEVWDRSRIIGILDHWVPPPTVDAAEIHRNCRGFVKKYNLSNWYDMTAGICHQVMPEKGHVCPGELIVGTDSHTTTYGALNAFSTGVGVTDMTVIFAKGRLWFRVPETIKYVVTGKLGNLVVSKDVILRVLKDLGAEGAAYKALEFHGDTIREMSIDGRMTVCNLGVEAGAKSAIVPPDEKTIEYARSKTDRPFTPVNADPEAQYSEERAVDVSDLEPQVAKPPDPCNSVPVGEVQGTPIDEAFIGSCTNGRIEDLRVAARILKNQHVPTAVRLIVIPASYEIYLQAVQEGIVETVLRSRGIFEAPTCGPCIGGHLGLLASGEKAIATVPRNFVGRMGSPKAEVYLASPATVAASAINGEITDPREV